MKPIPLSMLLMLAVAATGISANQTGTLTAAEAASLAQRQYGGKVLDIRLQKNGRYRVKILNDGRIRVISIDRNRRKGGE